MDIWVLALLGLVGLVAGFVDSIAGGGGLLCLPSLMLAGLDPLSALATNKLQGTFGTGSATWAFARKGHLSLKGNMPAVITTFAGAALGVAAVSLAPLGLLRAGLPVLLIAMALYFALSPRLSNDDAHPRLKPIAFIAGFAPVIGFYDGIFGPGTGSFFMLCLVTLFGLGIVRATATTKLMNFTSNIASLLMFVAGGKILWTAGLVMGLGQVIGAQVGSHLAMAKGAAIIRPLLVIVCCAMAIRLLSDPANPIRVFVGI
jgi:uncharacterized membrane protein YfcA